MTRSDGITKKYSKDQWRAKEAGGCLVNFIIVTYNKKAILAVDVKTSNEGY